MDAHSVGGRDELCCLVPIADLPGAFHGLPCYVGLLVQIGKIFSAKISPILNHFAANRGFVKPPLGCGSRIK